MTAKTIALGALLLAMPAIAHARGAAQDARSFDLAKVKIDGCAGERFDFALPESPGTKVSLCSNAGASKDEKAAMLESAIGNSKRPTGCSRRSATASSR